MVAKQIRRELSDMLLTDTVLQFAILPEAALGADRYLSSLTTISDVEVSSDLQVLILYWVFLDLENLYSFWDFLFSSFFSKLNFCFDHWWVVIWVRMENKR